MSAKPHVGAISCRQSWTLAKLSEGSAFRRLPCEVSGCKDGKCLPILLEMRS